MPAEPSYDLEPSHDYDPDPDPEIAKTLLSA